MVGGLEERVLASIPRPGNHFGSVVRACDLRLSYPMSFQNGKGDSGSCLISLCLSDLKIHLHVFVFCSIFWIFRLARIF